MEEVKLKLKPKYSFIYELLMPTGRNVNNAIISIFIMCIIYAFLSISKVENANGIFASLNIEDIMIIVKTFAVILLIIAIMYFAIRLIFQIMEYNKISYTFFEDKVVFEDLFLNQNRKTLLYSNIKEIEIKRSIWDRLNRRGIIILSTNAEKKASKGMVIYSVKDVKKIYDDISNLIYTYNDNAKNNISSGVACNHNVEEKKEDLTRLNTIMGTNIDSEHVTTVQSQKAFEESLKN